MPAATSQKAIKAGTRTNTAYFNVVWVKVNRSQIVQACWPGPPQGTKAAWQVLKAKNENKKIAAPNIKELVSDFIISPDRISLTDYNTKNNSTDPKSIKQEG